MSGIEPFQYVLRSVIIAAIVYVWLAHLAPVFWPKGPVLGRLALGLSGALTCVFLLSVVLG